MTIERCIKLAETYSVVNATEFIGKKELFMEKLLELIELELDMRLTKLKGFSGVLPNKEIICSETWTLALESSREELRLFFKDLS